MTARRMAVRSTRDMGRDDIHDAELATGVVVTGKLSS
jgi:hypothetical protein